VHTHIPIGMGLRKRQLSASSRASFNTAKDSIRDSRDSARGSGRDIGRDSARGSGRDIGRDSAQDSARDSRKQQWPAVTVTTTATTATTADLRRRTYSSSGESFSTAYSTDRNTYTTRDGDSSTALVSQAPRQLYHTCDEYASARDTNEFEQDQELDRDQAQLVHTQPHES
jgi:hypothetical protein